MFSNIFVKFVLIGVFVIFGLVEVIFTGVVPIDIRLSHFCIFFYILIWVDAA